MSTSPAIHIFAIPAIIAVQGDVRLQITLEQLLKSGFTDMGGCLIGGVKSPQFGFERFSRNRETVIQFQIEDQRDSRKILSWKCLDSIKVKLASKDVVVFGDGCCFIDGRMDPEIVCIAIDGSSEYLRVRRAWRANRKTQRFEPIPTKGVKCINEGYGV